MKIYRFSVTLVFITLVALFYVHQQVQLLKVSYQINTSESKVTRLLDENRALIYNITRLKSPVHLGKNFLASKKDFSIPQQWQVVEVRSPKEDTRALEMVRLEKKPTGIFRIFGKPKEAFADTR